MIALVVNFQVKKDKVDGFLTTIAPLIKGSQAEAGCIEYDLYQDDEKDFTYTLIEKWKDQAALDFHNQTDHFKTYAPPLGDLCENVTLNRLIPTE